MKKSILLIVAILLSTTVLFAQKKKPKEASKAKPLTEATAKSGITYHFELDVNATDMQNVLSALKYSSYALHHSDVSSINTTYSEEAFNGFFSPIITQIEDQNKKYNAKQDSINKAKTPPTTPPAKQ